MASNPTDVPNIVSYGLLLSILWGFPNIISAIMHSIKNRKIDGIRCLSLEEEKRRLEWKITGYESKLKKYQKKYKKRNK